jgi:ergothioneine biosynthesis protein EgtB
VTRDELAALYASVRRVTERLVEPLAVEDMVVQTMPDASPIKWHLGHTTWFFETFVLAPAGVAPRDARFGALFNSYYNAAGAAHPRAARGQLSRPTIDEIRAWRRHVDAEIAARIASARDDAFAALAGTIELGVNHEEQHQELIVTDAKHALAANPLAPPYCRAAPAASRAVPLAWRAIDGGLVEIGHAGASFAYDNEQSRHRRWIEPFAIATRPATCGEWLEFVRERGYERAELWLSDGWDACRANGWRAPLYWRGGGTEWTIATLAGERALDPHEPACHVSFYEADAFARWAGARLPFEHEWEHVAAAHAIDGNFVETGAFHPRSLAAAPPAGTVAQLFGDVWEWTRSAYEPYPSYRPYQGAVAEYNGKFMCNQFVLRGGSCATPRRHVRSTYRNFFPPAARWQFAGVRLAR